jgi:hypothetical protein
MMNKLDEIREGLTYSGDTPGIMINGIGPMPKAKQLKENVVKRKDIASNEQPYLTKSKVPMADPMLI